MEAQHERYEKKLKADAVKALAKLDEQPEAAQESARAAHSQLYEWLTRMHGVFVNPPTLADDSMANFGCNAFEQALAQQIQNLPKDEAKPWKKLLEAFRAIDDDGQLNLIRFVLSSVFGQFTQGVVMVSRGRNDPREIWEHTGFLVDGQCVFAKLGKNPYQVIGFDDGQRYVATEGSKLLWNRVFGFAPIVPWAPAFEVETQEIEEILNPELPNALSNAEREKMEEVLGWFEEDRKALDTLSGNQSNLDGEEYAKQRAELDDKVRETIKLARLRLPRLDRNCSDYLEENPEFAPDFQGLETSQLLITMSEYLHLLLDDDQVRRDVQSTSLHVRSADSAQLSLIDSSLETLSALVPPEGRDVDGFRVNEALDHAAFALPMIKDLLDELRQSGKVVTAFDALKAAMVWLQQERDRLTEEDDESAVETEMDEQEERS